VDSLYSTGSTLFVGGLFSTAGDAPAHSAAQWTGSQWVPLGSGVAGLSGDVFTLGMDNSGALYAGGPFYTAGGMASDFFAMYQNDPPHYAANPLVLTPNPAKTGAPVQASCAFLDADSTDTHQVSISWGDGLDTLLSLPAGVLTFQASHTYAHPAIPMPTCPPCQRPASRSNS
jgi:hypothetical protein